jgi:calcineurin-like phosphoesterase family protein
MANIFLCSDHHLSHSGIITFTSNGVDIIRKFDTIEAHDEHLIEQHNKVVKPADRVYFLGDVVFSKKHIHLLSRMHGRKVLVKGNHDKLRLIDYAPYFDDIRGCHQFDGMFLSHVPIHPQSLSRWKVNVHGHLHHNRVMVDKPKNSYDYDERYQNVSMEQLIQYTPISLEEMKSRLKYLDLM